MSELFFAPDPLVRLPFYIAFGLITEVLYTATADLIFPHFMESWHAKQNSEAKPEDKKRDSRAVGYTFLWMIPIYAFLIMMEPLSQKMLGWPLLMRGLVYLAVFWLAEYTTGALIKKISGKCPWDYSYSKWSVHGYIRWDMGPLWFLFALVVERFSEKLVLLTPYLKDVFFS